MGGSRLTPENDPSSTLIAELGTVSSPGTLTLIYDGECPFCSRFVALYNIRKHVGVVDLIDARSRPDLVAKLRNTQIEINDGMVAIWNGRLYYGSESVHLMSMLTSEGLFAKVNWLLFRNRAVAASIYPVMVAGRKLALRLLGRPLIAA